MHMLRYRLNHLITRPRLSQSSLRENIASVRSVKPGNLIGHIIAPRVDDACSRWIIIALGWRLALGCAITKPLSSSWYTPASFATRASRPVPSGLGAT